MNSDAEAQLLRKHGVQVISINEPVDNSPAGKLPEGMIEVIDEFYSRNLADDVVRGMAENAEKGFFNGGPTPFGYRRVITKIGNIQKSKLEPDETEIPIVKRVFQLAFAGEGTKNIAKILNKDGLKIRAGKPWSKTLIDKILRNEVHTGTMVWADKGGKNVHCQNAHPALVSREDFDKVQRLLVDRRPRVRHPRTVTSQYLLSSLIHCARCGAAMIRATAKSGSYHYYKCNNRLKRGKEVCATPMVSKARIESFVIDRLKVKVLTEENLTELVRIVSEEIELLADHKQERLKEIDRQLDSINQKLLKYYTAFEYGTMSEEDVVPRIKEFRVEQIRLQEIRGEALMDVADKKPRELDRDKVLSYAQNLSNLLSKSSFIEQKTFLRSFIKSINFEPGQVAIEYTIPLPTEKGKTSEQEVLSIGCNGEPLGSIDRTPNMVFRAEFAFV